MARSQATTVTAAIHPILSNKNYPHTPIQDRGLKKPGQSPLVRPFF